jgi:hypothetical protein
MNGVLVQCQIYQLFDSIEMIKTENVNLGKLKVFVGNTI